MREVAGPRRQLQAPGFAQHLILLWGLRLQIGLNTGKGNQRALAVLGFLASSAPAVVLGAGAYQLMHYPLIAKSQHWPDFVINLLCFVTACGWVTWPILSAGVDDHSEVSRYAAFPISSFRLMAASTLASLFEPRAIVFYAPLTGAALGYVDVRGIGAWWMVPLLYVAFALFNASLSRVGLHMMLNVLRQQRSAELLGGAFVLTLIACSFIPPIDTTWLTEMGANVQAVPDTIIADAALALGRFPTGWFGHGLHMLSAHRIDLALADLVGIVEFTMISLAVAYGLLIDFHRHSGRGGSIGNTARAANPFAKTKGRFATLVVREAVDLWHNPRARLLASVPFVLSILLKLLSARNLFEFFLGATVDAWVMGSLCLYGAVVIASTFSQNTFAYDGHGFTVFVSAPVPLGDVLKAKNLVHAGAAFALATLEAIFYVVYFGHGSWLEVACSLAAVAVLVAVLLAAGNFLSLYYPVKFHANLRRRDKLPFAASMLGVAAASVGTAPFAWSLRLCGQGGVTLTTLALLSLSAALAWVCYRGFLPLALRVLTQRRELVLRAVTRE